MHRLLPLLLLSACALYFPEQDEGSEAGDDGAAPGEDVFIAVGDQGALLSSADAVTWTVRTSGVNVALRDVAYGDAGWVAVGQAGKIVASDDGVTWRAASSPSSRDLHAVAWHVDRYFAVGGDDSAGAETLTSLDGTTWTRPEVPVVQHVLTGLASDGARLVAIGHFQPDLRTFGLFTWTGDMLGWEQRIDGGVTGTTFDAVAAGAPAFAMVGSGVAASSDDGAVWTSRNVPLAPPMHGLVFTGLGWIAVGDGGGVLTSTDAVAWTSRTTPVAQPLQDVATDGAVLVAVGPAGTLLASTDGVTWTPQTSELTVDLHAVTHNRE
jgi:hypothetical protein